MVDWQGTIKPCPSKHSVNTSFHAAGQCDLNISSDIPSNGALSKFGDRVFDFLFMIARYLLLESNGFSSIYLSRELFYQFPTNCYRIGIYIERAFVSYTGECDGAPEAVRSELDSKSWDTDKDEYFLAIQAGLDNCELMK